jgi:hypothetical protein
MKKSKSVWTKIKDNWVIFRILRFSTQSSKALRMKKINRKISQYAIK